MKKIKSWDRKFQVWQYSVTHSTLLLRSFHPQAYQTRIDILFPAVSFMHLSPSYERMEISLGEGIDVATFPRPSSNQKEEGDLYVINGGEGYLYAADFHWHEDEGDHRSPSAFGPLRGTK